MIKKYFILYFLIFLYGSELFAQSGLNTLPAGKFVPVTDRGIYVSGEQIFFYVNNIDHEKDIVSKVLYADLVSPDGQIIASGKFPLKSNLVSGALNIPDDTYTGTYYLNVYTRWQRNYSLHAASYLSVRIINPFTMNHLPVNISGETRVVTRSSDLQKPIVNLESSLSASGVGRREELSLKLSLPSGVPGKTLSISVVPSGIAQKQIRNLISENPANPDSIMLIPETRGITLTGLVFDQEDLSPASYSPVFLTLLDSERSFYPVMSDSLGRFFFSLPDHKGERELFISAQNMKGEKLEILIESDLATNRLIMPSLPLDIDSSEYNTILSLAQNKQLRDQYYGKNEYSQKDPVHYNKLFYGDPVKIVKIGEYIDLPSMEEYFLELLPMVSVYRTAGETKFRINAPQAEMNIYDPLVLVDGVAMHDNDAVLSINPGNIKTIEIIDSPWIRGDMIFGGIISMISNSQDFAGVDLPESGLFLTYNFFEHIKPAPQSMKSAKNNIPDVRNTLFWNPEVNLLPGMDKEIKFTTADLTGKYDIVIREITPTGKINRSVMNFIVQ